MTPNAAIIGVGGFARAHHDAALALESQDRMRLRCTCDPDPELRARAAAELDFDQRGVAAYPDHEAMLAAHGAALDLVTIPTPIPLHRPMHLAAVELGIPVYLEKPPTLDWQELEAMIETDRRADRQTYVGFNFIVDPVRQALKTRLLAGDFGQLQTVSVAGAWPRARSYFRRNNWAGRLAGQDCLILDSVAGNAMSHFVHNALFWAGTDKLFDWGRPTRVRSELYRAHDIEGTDSFFVRAETEQGPELRVALTHAVPPPTTYVRESFACSDATVSYGHGEGATIAWKDGRRETIASEDFNPVALNFAAMLAYLGGEMPRPTTTLPDCRPFVQLYDLAYIAAGAITEPAPEHIIQATTKGQEWVGIHNIEQALRGLCEHGRLPSEEGLPWARPGGEATPADLPKLHQTIQTMRQGE